MPTQSGTVPQGASLPFEPLAQFLPAIASDAELAQCQGKKIGILIVAYNALTTLTKVLKRITPNVWANVEEIAVFDDASQDSTYELAVGMKAMRDLPKLHVLRHAKNLGYGGNQKAGYQYFIERGFDIVVLLHGDGQYAPEILSQMYAPIVRGEADAVFGSRMMQKYGGPLKGGMPLYKYAGNRILTTYENAALGMNLTEFHSGYRAYNLHALKKIDFTHMADVFHFDTEIIIKLHHQHFRIAEVPIPTFYGDEICYVNGMRYAKDIVRAVSRYRKTCLGAVCYPEFQEYFVNSPVKTAPHSVHVYAQRAVGVSDRVLELGCGAGLFSAELKKQGKRSITGVDARPEPEDDAIFDEYISADLNGGLERLQRALSGKRFDKVLLLDTLEHLQHPEALLSAAREWMEPAGAAVVSVPNIAHLWMRLQLLAGRFDYSSRGILDRTHLRFFTRKSARRLMRESGYQIVVEKATVPPFELVLGLSPNNPVVRLLNFVSAVLARLWPSMFGYQFVFVLARRANP
ncbi:MAG: methyltransferase domain-containing protein [Acidobacteriia bacterium]|nr:methyltransferase domain-containing protein [Terriglobia bacterium]